MIPLIDIVYRSKRLSSDNTIKRYKKRGHQRTKPAAGQKGKKTTPEREIINDSAKSDIPTKKIMKF
jgi:hypothetical protein